MTRQVLIDVGLFQTRIAWLTDEILTDISLYPTGHSSSIDEIYLGRVNAFADGLEAAFIDIGQKQDGFLLSAHTPKGKASDTNAPLCQKLHEGQKLLVQVIKDKKHDKSLQLSAFIQFDSQNLVFKPMSNGLVFSRQIKDQFFKESVTHSLAEELGTNSGGITVRSSGITQSASQLQNEFRILRADWQNLQKLARNDQKPRCLRPSGPPELHALKKNSSEETQVVINNRQRFSRLINSKMPEIGRIELWTGSGLLFDTFDVEAQLEEAQEIRISLPSGGNITIEQTEALVVIDVNSGSLTAKTGKKSVANITNTEAASQICRQIRLRNLSGIIIVDFIRDQDKGSVQTLTNQLKQLTQNDPSPVRIIGMTELGLMQLTRQRKEASLSELLGTTLADTCSHITVQHAATILHQLARYCTDHKIAILSLRTGNALNPLMQRYKTQIEAHLGVHIHWKEDASLSGLQYTFGTMNDD